MKKEIKQNDLKDLKCGDCDNFMGCGDWNLCCKEKHEEEGFPFGFLCYADTPACEKFKHKKEK